MNSANATKGRLRLTLPMALLSSAMLLFACGGEDDDDRGEDPPRTFTCQASISPSTFDYVVQGDVLEVTANGESAFLDLVAVGDPSRPVYGVWHIGTDTTPVGTLSLDLEIEPDRVSVLGDCDFGRVSANVVATSSAEITDTSITIFEFDEDTEVVTD